MHTCEKIWEHVADLVSHHKFLFAFVIAMLTIQLVTVLLIAPAFADVSPELGGYAAAKQRVGQPIQLAQADAPSGVGSIDDYMHQSGDGPSTAPAAPTYSPRPAPRYASQPSSPLEWNNPNANPNAQRDLLIGAAVVGAIALGVWAYHQHQEYQAQRRYRRRFNGPAPEFPY